MKNLLRGYREKAKILIVDDDRTTVVLLANIFKKEYEVFTTTKGLEAVEMANEILPDLILLDVMMPDLDGYKIGIKLKSDTNTKDIPIIFITSLNDPQSETLGLKIGAIDYIHKPINPLIANLRVQNHLELKRQRDMLTKLSYLDGLTGCYNRRWFDQIYPTTWKNCLKDKKPLTVFLLDIDHFKLYNETYGHLAGDDCLKFIVNTIHSILKRPTDICARYGGEEFVGLIYNANLEGGEVISEKIRSAVENAGIPNEASPSKIVTVTIGSASGYPGVDKNSKGLIALADKLLYQAKTNGRNRIAAELLSIGEDTGNS
jgi:diguanylate cyclase (GGDEF)-like protein